MRRYYAGLAKAFPGASGYEIEETERDIQRLVPRPNGTTWVLSSRGDYDAPEGDLGIFDIWSRDGQRSEQVELRVPFERECDQLFVRGNRLFVVVGGKSAQRAIARGNPGGEETFGTDPCVEAPQRPSMSMLCYELDE